MIEKILQGNPHRSSKYEFCVQVRLDLPHLGGRYLSLGSCDAVQSD